MKNINGHDHPFTCTVIFASRALLTLMSCGPSLVTYDLSGVPSNNLPFKIFY